MKNSKKISEKLIIENPFLKVTKKDFQDENGEISSFLVTGHNRKKTIGTMIMPITEDGKILYLKEYRYGPEKIVINFPVGILEDGVSEIENCKSELAEETGYYSDEIVYLTETIVENYFEGKVVYYLAKNCKKISNQELENGEKIEVYEATIDEFEKMIFDGKVESSKTAFCFLFARGKRAYSHTNKKVNINGQ